MQLPNYQSLLYHRVLEETLPGYMLNNLIWCGDPKSQSGIDYQSCPDDCDRGETVFTFWQAASREVKQRLRSATRIHYKYVLGIFSIAMNLRVVVSLVWSGLV